MKTYKLQNPFLLFICLITLCSLASCSPSSKKPIPVYFSTPLTGKEKGYKILNAAQLYTNDHPESNLELHPVDSKSDDQLSTKQIMSFLKEKDPKIIFGPPGSSGADAFLEAVKQLPPGEQKKLFFLNQVTASPKMNFSLSQINVFFKTEDYLSGVIDFILTKEKKPRRAHIIHLEDVPYLDDVAEFARKDLRKNSISIGLDIAIPEKGSPVLLEKWKKTDIKKEDWVFLITHNIPDTFRTLQDDKLFSEVTKIITYGKAHSYVKNHPWLYKNSWQALFWHPDLEYKGSGSLSNCDFESKFEQNFHHKPDFHSAFTYSMFEVAAALKFANPFLREEGLVGLPPISSLTGEVQWDEKGLRLSLRPILFHQEETISEIYLTPSIKKVCDSPRYLKDTLIKNWDTSPAKLNDNVWKKSIKGDSRFIPVQLWNGSEWDGNQVLSMEEGRDKIFNHTNTRGHTYTKEVSKALQWFHPRMNRSFLVYKRISPKTPKVEAKTQLFTLTDDLQGIGRLFDTREGNYYAYNEIKFPLGWWKKGEEKTFKHPRWYQGDTKPREFTSTIKILEIDFSYNNVPHSLKYELVIHDENHKIITRNIYIYSPNQANVLSQNLLNQYQ